MGTQRNHGSHAVAEVMSRHLLTTSPNATVRTAREVMQEHHVEHLLVLDCDNVVGVICTCDMDGLRGHALVSRCMKADVVMIAPSATLEDAARLMRTRVVGCLPVASGNLLLGIVTREELARAGIPRGELGPACTTCGARHHVRAPEDIGQPPFCGPCLESPEPTEDSELGAGD